MRFSLARGSHGRASGEKSPTARKAQAGNVFSSEGRAGRTAFSDRGAGREARQRLIEWSIDPIYFFDDRSTITFDGKDGKRAVRLSEPDAAKNPDNKRFGAQSGEARTNPTNRRRLALRKRRKAEDTGSAHQAKLRK